MRDRLSWMRCCGFGLGLGDVVPDANSPQDFREALIAANALDGLFARFDGAITEAGVAADEPEDMGFGQHVIGEVRYHRRQCAVMGPTIDRVLDVRHVVPERPRRRRRA